MALPHRADPSSQGGLEGSGGWPRSHLSEKARRRRDAEGAEGPDRWAQPLPRIDRERFLESLRALGAFAEGVEHVREIDPRVPANIGPPRRAAARSRPSLPPMPPRQGFGVPAFPLVSWCRRGDLNPYAPQRALGPQPSEGVSRGVLPSYPCWSVPVWQYVAPRRRWEWPEDGRTSTSPTPRIRPPEELASRGAIAFTQGLGAI